MDRATDAAVRDRLARLAGSAETELRGRILPFWLKQADPARGGFFGAASSRGRALPSAAKGAVMHARILWTFSAAHRRYAAPELLAAAQAAWRFLADHLVDRRHGGVIWSADADGAAADARKHLYAQAFAIFALAQFHLASGEAAPLSLAQALWRLVEARAARDVGYAESFAQDWTPAPSDLMGRADAARSFNAHLHLLEAYGELWRVWPDPALAARIETLTDLLVGAIHERRTFPQFFDPQMRALDAGGSHGHDIEACWLIPAAAGRVSAALAQRARAAMGGVAAAVLDRAVQPDGGLDTGLDASGRADPGRIWWIQAEALVGFLDAFEQAGEPRFLDAAEGVWRFIETAVIDETAGEWRWRVTAPDQPVQVLPLAHLWKCPYHNGRACLETIARSRRLADAQPSAATSASTAAP
jgi:mannobiose 2-epimerase